MKELMSFDVAKEFLDTAEKVIIQIKKQLYKILNINPDDYNLI